MHNSPQKNPSTPGAGQLSRIKKEKKEFPFALFALIFVLVMIVLVNAACTPVAARQSSPGPVKSGDILFSDDFSDPPSGWGIWARDGALVEYANNGLRILVNEPQYDFWSVAGLNFEDVQIEVDAAKIGGPDDNDFGIICRYQDKDNFYMLVVSNDGYYGIAKMSSGQYSMIGPQQLQYTGSAIASGQQRNHLRADCVGSQLSLYANGHKLMETEDEDFRSGDVGVIAGAYDVQGVDISFDNFVVKKP